MGSNLLLHRSRVARRAALMPRLAAAICCLLAANTLCLAQGVRGTISGVVTDPNGALLPGATVRLENVATGQVVRTGSTGDDGVFQFVEIDPATYHVLISATGVSDARLLEVKVEPNRNVRLDTSLGVTGAAETVEVTAGAELIDKESATLGTTVDRQRVQGLPLNGRNVLQLAVLQPGVIPSGAGFTGAGTGFSVNGSRPVENNITLDGANNNEVATGGTTAPQPRPDAVQEFRLLTSNYEAEFGRNTGSIVNVVTRSGTNEYHGNVRFFWRPTFLSAARYFDKANATEEQRESGEDLRRPYERKEFGGNIGGPIKIPGFYDGTDRTFFFVDYEGRRQLIGNSVALSGLPSAAERQGDFSDLGRVVRDPATGQPFPGNIIPADRFSPIAQFYLQFIPLGNEDGQANVRGDDVENFDQITARFDHLITSNQTINYTLVHFDLNGSRAFAFGGANVTGFGDTTKSTTQNHVLRHTWTLSSTLVNSFLFAYARNNFPSVRPLNKTTAQEAGFTGNFVVSPEFAGLPNVRLLDRGLIIGNSIQGPQARVPENFQIQDSLSWVLGDHRMKFGFDGTLYRQDQAFLFINQGIFSYTRTGGGNTTGDDLADFLIGNGPAALQTGNNGERDFRQKYVSFFAQDTWRVLPELTLSYGLRYEYTSPITDTRNRVSYYRPGVTSQLLEQGLINDPNTGLPILVRPGGRAPNGIVYVGDPDPVLGGTVPDGGIRKDFNNFAPRFGIAWAPTSNKKFLRTVLGENATAIRAGIGMYYGYIIGDTALQQLSAPGFNATGVFYFPASGTLADPFAPDPYPDFRGDQGELANPFTAEGLFVSAPINNTAQPVNPLIRTPYSVQWNLTVEREFLDNYVASVSYVGSRGVKLYVREQINPSLGTYFAVPADRTIPVPTTTNANLRRLNDDLRGGVVELNSAGTSDYHALEAQVQRRFSNGLTFQAAYTFSKAISDADTQRGQLDALDRKFGRSVSGFDVPHRFVANGLWEIPFAENTDGVVNRLLDGWGVGGIATFQTGTPFTVGNLFDTTATGGAIFSFADLGAPYMNLDPRENNSRAFNVDAFQSFGDPSDGFAVATDFRRGNQAANQFRLENGIHNWDLIVTKKTRLWGDTSNLELRFEFFNAFNHAQFTTVDTNLNNIVIDPETGKPDPLKSTFGRFIDTREPRVIQFGARISF